MISIIVAMDENNGIGINNELPWHIKEDLARFKRLTMSHHLILGRKTFESIGRPLPGRDIIILTKDSKFHVEGVTVVKTIEEALTLAQQDEEIFIGGGSTVYEQTVDIADRIYLTIVHTVVETDKRFPVINSIDWTESDVSSHVGSGVSYTFKTLDRFVLKPT